MRNRNWIILNEPCSLIELGLFQQKSTHLRVDLPFLSVGQCSFFILLRLLRHHLQNWT